MNQRLAFSLIAAGLLAAAVLAPLNVATAQNESGRRSLYRPGFGSNWHNDTADVFRYAFPIIRSLPPLNSSMPWDVMAAYIVADSIVRFDTRDTTEKWLQSRRSMSDTLAGLLRFLYRMKEYDPTIFEQYCNDVDLNRGERYRASIRGITSAAEAALIRTAPSRAEAAALYSAFVSDYVLHVRVVAVDSMPLIPPSVAVTAVFRATVEVLDTLKGGFVPSCQGESYRAENEKRGRNNRLVTATSCTYVNFSNATLWNPSTPVEPLGPTSPVTKAYTARDSAFCYSASDSSFRLHPGQEAILFLTYGNHRLDSTHDYFELDVCASASFGALPVINGRVRDVNHVWTNNLWTDYATWRERFFAVRQKIVAGRY